jgi:chromosome segregation ATPase
VHRYEEQPLRRAWLRGYRKADVELSLAQSRLHVQGLEQELDSLRRRTDDLADEAKGLRERDFAVRSKEVELVEALSAVRQERERLEAEAQARARELVTEAETRAAEARAEAQRRVEELQSQTQELLVLRRRLVAEVRHAVDEIDTVVRQVEAEEPGVRPIVSDLSPQTRRD